MSLGGRATRAVVLALFLGALPATLLINHLPSGETGGVTIANGAPLDTTFTETQILTQTDTATIITTQTDTATIITTQTATQTINNTATATQTINNTATATQTINNTATTTATDLQTTTANHLITRTSVRSSVIVIPGTVTVRTITPPPGQGPPIVVTFSAPPQTITTSPTDTILSAATGEVTPAPGTPFWVYLVILGAVVVMIVAAVLAVMGRPRGTHG